MLANNRNFSFFLSGRAYGTLAIQMQAVAVHWLVYDITKDPLFLGFIGLIEAVPALSVSLYAGHFADHHSRRRIVLACLLLLVASSLGLVFAVSVNLPVQILLLFLFTAILLTGFARGFFAPAAFGLMSQILDSRNYAKGSAWNSSVWHIAWIVGAVSGGWVLQMLSASLAFLIVTGGFVFAFGSFFLIQDQGIPHAQIQNSAVRDIKEGLSFLLSQPVILGAMSLDLFAVLFGGVAAVLPMFASEVFFRGPDALGILRSAVPAGAFLASLFMTRHPPKRWIGPRMLLAVSGFGIFTLLFALTPWMFGKAHTFFTSPDLAFSLSPSLSFSLELSDSLRQTVIFWTAVFFLVLSGTMDGYSVVVRSTLIQSLVPDRLRGKVAAISSIFIGSSNEIGAFESGLAARILGLVPSVVFGTSITQLSVLAVAWLVPHFRRFDKIETPHIPHDS